MNNITCQGCGKEFSASSRKHVKCFDCMNPGFTDWLKSKYPKGKKCATFALLEWKNQIRENGQDE